MKHIDTDTIKKAQAVMLEMLIEFDKICQKYNLKYWLDSGTLLGAVRHDGFIPWDDDIDISMPVEDYNEFTKIAQSELSDGMFLQNKKTDPTFPFDYNKIRSSKATIIEFHEEGKDVDYHQGVFVDIFPMLCVEKTKNNHIFYQDALASIRFFSAKNIDHMDTRSFVISSLEKLHLGWDKKEDTSVIYGGEMPDVAGAFDYEAIFPLKKMKFEQIEFFVPNDCDHYLKELYSKSYMEIPPKEKQTVHAAKMTIVDSPFKV